MPSVRKQINAVASPNGDGVAQDAAGRPNDIRCDGEVVEIASLVPDPNNARLHPERNVEAIKDSLRRYGQKEPLVVRAENRMIAAGNGRRTAMLEIGWTKCAATIRPMTDEEFTGFALADNRTAELARWDLEVVARLEQLQGAAGMVGWTAEDIAKLRLAEAGPSDFPEVDEDIEVEHVCPKCGYGFSGGQERIKDA